MCKTWSCIKSLICLLLMTTSGFPLADHNDALSPWLTGPLLTPSGHVVPEGYINFEPYLFYNVTTGLYNSDWKGVPIPNFTNLNLQLPFWIGLTEWMDIQIVPQGSWNTTEGESSAVFNDLSLSLEFQLLEDTQTNKLPGIKVYIEESFPFGYYENRDPEKLLTDIGGSGSFETSLGFVITRLFHISCAHWLSIRFNGQYTLPSNVHVRGLNAYGGSSNTKGTIKPGHLLQTLLGVEYSLTRNWALAADLDIFFRFKDHFSGKTGTLPNGSPALIGRKEAWQFSVAPAIEYNFSESFGIVGGAWLTFAGKNTRRFVSGVIALNYYGPKKKSERHKFRQTGGGAG